jgi:hypothetical protein
MENIQRKLNPMEITTQPLAWHDLQWCLTRSPRKLLEAMRKHGSIIMVAGGYVRACVSNETLNDVDVFVPSKEFGHALARELVDGKDAKIHESPNAFTLRGFGIPIQIIHRWTFTNPVDAIQSFDFTIARAAFWWNILGPDNGEWKSICDSRFYQDLAGKRLIYCQPQRIEECGGSMLRVLKFYQRGYRIPLDSLGFVIARLLTGLSLTQDKIVENFDSERKDWHAKILEAEVGRVISGLLREVDPAIDPTHVAHLPSQQNDAATSTE